MNADGASRLLFDRWRALAARHRDDLALVEFSSGRRWSFRQLLGQTETGTPHSTGIAYPSGNNAEFILSVLRAWRNGVITCPLEAGQRPPEIPSVPKSFGHVKLTSASTGSAKAIVFTPEQLAADAENIVSTMGLHPSQPNLACISLSHSYGFSNLVLPLVLHGIPLILVPAPLPQTVLSAARQFPKITLPSVPALWRSWHSNNAIPPNVSLAISAGAPLPLDLEREIFESAGVKVHNFYGSSECGGIAFDRSAGPRSEPGLAGTALNNVSLSLTETGSLVVEGAAVATSYWPDAQPCLRAGRFETTDLAELQNGLVYLRGRLTDVINVAGRKAVPETIESALKTHAAVNECVVFGAGDSRSDRGELIVACLNTSGDVGIAELARFLSERLPAWQIPREWWFTNELAPNPRGKISRAEWRQRFETHQTARTAGETPKNRH